MSDDDRDVEHHHCVANQNDREHGSAVIGHGQLHCSQTGPSLQLFRVPGPLQFDLGSGAINLTEIVGGKFD